MIPVRRCRMPLPRLTAKQERLSEGEARERANLARILTRQMVLGVTLQSMMIEAGMAVILVSCANWYLRRVIVHTLENEKRMVMPGYLPRL